MEEITGKDFGLKNLKGRPLVTNEVAQIMRTSESWVRHGMRDGTFPVPYRKISPRIHIVDSVDLDDYLSKILHEPGKAQMPLRAIKKLQKEVIAH